MECYCNRCEEWVQGKSNDEDPSDQTKYCELCSQPVFTYDTQVAFAVELNFGF